MNLTEDIRHHAAEQGINEERSSSRAWKKSPVGSAKRVASFARRREAFVGVLECPYFDI